MSKSGRRAVPRHQGSAKLRVSALAGCLAALTACSVLVSPAMASEAGAKPTVRTTPGEGRSDVADPRTTLLPVPQNWEPAGGKLTLANTTRVVIDPATAGRWTVVSGMTTESDPIVSTRPLREVARYAARDIEARTGVRLPLTQANSANDNGIQVALDAALAPEVGPEGYRLEIGRTVRLTAPTASGIYYGSRSLIQLLVGSADQRTLPTGVLTDRANTTVRMNTIDVSREYWEPRAVADVIRQMGYLKQNYLVLHVDDAEGFRLNSPKYPGLAEPGFSYDRADIESLDRIARENNVTLVPGFELPAHVSPKSAYFHIGMADGPREVEPGFGERDTGATPQNTCQGYSYSHLTDDFTFNLMNPKALKVSQEMLDEFLPWFSSPWVHLGGDEMPPNMNRCPALRDYVANSNGKYATTADVEMKFINEVNDHVRAKGRTSVVYNGSEASARNIPLDTNVIVMDWTGSGTADHLKPYDKIVADGNFLYLVPARSGRPDQQRIAQTWTTPTDPKILGWGMHVWGDDLGWAEGQWLESLSITPRGRVADRQWNTRPRTQTEYAAYEAAMQTIGTAPGYTGVQQPNATTNARPIHQYVMDPEFPRGTYDAHTSNNRRGIIDRCDLSGMTPLSVSTRSATDPDKGQVKVIDSGGYWLGASNLTGPWSVTGTAKVSGTVTLLGQVDSTNRVTLSPTDVTVRWNGVTQSFGRGLGSGQWADFALTSDGSTVTLYLDGERVGTVTSELTLPRSRMLYGATGTTLAALDIYAQRLTADQVSSVRTQRPEAVCATYPAAPTLPAPRPAGPPTRS
ncbi:family 20 glycosylhydrolase [Streptomyces sp. NPDC055692]|uniref:family 20 glycosylhydrolase n=1 Tax=Streptomyces sp. NPDC055692 TaxID=3155683 RepID=UPI003423DD3C